MVLDIRLLGTNSWSVVSIPVSNPALRKWEKWRKAFVKYLPRIRLCLQSIWNHSAAFYWYLTAKQKHRVIKWFGYRHTAIWEPLFKPRADSRVHGLSRIAEAAVTDHLLDGLPVELPLYSPSAAGPLVFDHIYAFWEISSCTWKSKSSGWDWRWSPGRLERVRRGAKIQG
jgi:hypothetical protein